MKKPLFCALLVVTAFGAFYLGGEFGQRFQGTSNQNSLPSAFDIKVGVQNFLSRGLEQINVVTYLGFKKKGPPENWSYGASNSTHLSDAHPIIFLHITKDKYWHPFRVCAVQSAAFHNPNRSVLVFTVYPMKKHPNWEQHPNIEMRKLNVAQVLEGTPLQEWHSKYSAMTSPPPAFAYDLADALRYAYLYKHGGIYLDTDVITLRPLEGVQNAVGMEDKTYLCNAVLFFEAGNPFLKLLLQQFSSTYNPKKWGSGGPLLVTRVAREYLGSKPSPQERPEKNFSIAGQKVFYPFRVQQARMMFVTSEQIPATHLAAKSLTVHLWKKALKTLHPSEKIQKHSFLDVIFHKYCS